MEVAAVDDRDVKALILCQFAYDLDSAEACADDDDACFLAHVLSPFLGAGKSPTWQRRESASASSAAVIRFAPEKLINV